MAEVKVFNALDIELAQKTQDIGKRPLSPTFSNSLIPR